MPRIEPPEAGPAPILALKAGRITTAAQLREWVRGAKPNARLAYGQGWSAKQVCSDELRNCVLSLAQLGLLTPHQLRAAPGEAMLYIVQRTARKVPPGIRL